jgi:protein-tyrosine phosphatase
MVETMYSREINFESVYNFRDLGGYKTESGRNIAWRRVFRSGMLDYMSDSDLLRLRTEIKLKSLLDLRSRAELERSGAQPLNGHWFHYYNIPLITGGSLGNREREAMSVSKHLGEVYLISVADCEYGKKLVEALRIISDPENHPIVFHCSAGKDRTGVLAAMLLGVLGVADEDIINDYTMTAVHIQRHISRLSRDPENAAFLQALPAYVHESSAGAMAHFLAVLKRNYGSVRGYVMAQGAESSLFQALDQSLLL